MILIISPRTDDHAAPVATELDRRGQKVAFFNLADFPAQTSISASISDDAPLVAEVVQGVERFRLEDVSAVWLRRIRKPVPPPESDCGFAVQESHQFLVGLARTMNRARWVNPLSALTMDSGWGKVRQLEVARACGLEIPKTLMTNDPERARDFVDSFPAKGCIYKPFTSPDYEDESGRMRSLYTTVVDDRLKDRLPLVAAAPGIFQEAIRKSVELRVTVMGDRAFACAVHSQDCAESQTDYRIRCFKHKRERWALPLDVELRLLRLHRELGLLFGTADMIVTPEGRHIFLETNQSGQWLWTADVFQDGEILGAFCDLLQGSSSRTLSSPKRSG